MPIKNKEEKTDKELVKESLQNPANLRYLIDKYEKPLARYLKRTFILKDEDIEDILQETFIKVYKNLNAYKEKYKFSSWIYRITHNEAINYLKKHKNIKNEVNPVDEEGESLVEKIASDIDIEKEHIDKEQSRLVKSALAKLDKKYRSVLVLRYLEEKEYNEISDILKVSTGTVGSLVSRAKNNLRKIYLDETKIKR